MHGYRMDCCMIKSYALRLPQGAQKVASWAGLTLVVTLAFLFIRFYSTLSTSKPVETKDKSKLIAPVETPLPDFTTYTDIPTKKEAFIRYMKPLIAWENRAIAQDRSRLSTLHQNFGIRTPSEKEIAWIESLAVKYRLTPFKVHEETHRETLLSRVDTIPLALAMAQAANESAWGTSRFAREGNNMFGQWVYGSTDGMVPKNRDAGSTHKVARFNSVSESIRSYLFNLNTLWAYEPLRELRKKQRAKGQDPDGETLALGIGRYSIRGEAYIKEIQQLIRLNTALITQI